MEDRMATCKCGCGAPIKGKRVFLDKEHQLAWMQAGGGAELAALLPDDARSRGGKTAGNKAVVSGHLREAARLGGRRVHEIAAACRTKRAAAEHASFERD
jgi:hypothetical protein